MGGFPKFADDCSGAGLARARSLPSHSRKLSDHPASVTRSDFLFHWLDPGHETFPVLRREIRSIQSNVSGARLHHHVDDLDVAHLSALAPGRETKRYFATRTGAGRCRPRGHRARTPARVTPKPF